MATTLTFLTLFLGLTTGLQPILVDVDGPVARVEVRLDGEACGSPRTLPPWHFNCDFGTALAPHELVAVAFDEDGEEVARAAQAINVAPRQAEAELILERDSEGRPIALQVTWESVEFDHPSAIDLVFDEQPIEVVDPRFVPLPLGVGFAGIHFATAEVSFPDGSSATADLAFGGRFGSSVSAENTAVPLEIDRREALRSAEDAGGLLLAGGAAARPLKLENPGADLVAVVEESAQETLLSFNRYFRHASGWERRSAGMRPRDRFFLVRPTPERSGERGGDAVQREIFRSSPARGAAEGGLAWQLTHVHFPPTGGNQQLADAVAVAGMQAAAGNRPRAVVLVLGPGLAGGDASRHDAASVRRFLDMLRVPLHVWWVEIKSSNRRDALPRRLHPTRGDGPQAAAAALAEAEAAWGPVERISTFQGLVGASRRLRDEIERQRILWIEGSHLPHQVATAHRADERFPGVGLLAGGTAVPAPPWAEGADLASVVRLARADDELPEALRDEGVRRAVEALDVVPVSLPGGPTLLPPGSMQTFQDALDVRLVEVEAVVTDRAGRPVGGLTRDDFVVYEDGRPMEISHFSVGGSLAAPAAAGIEPAATGAPVPTALAEPFHLVIYLDDAQMTAERRNRMLARLREFVAGGGLPAGTETMLVVRDAGLDLRQRFSDDPLDLLAGLDDAATGSAGGHERQRDRRRAIASMVGAADFEHALRAADLYAGQQGLAARLTVRHLETLVDSLAGLDGRKGLLYVGADLPMFAGQEVFLVLENLPEPLPGQRPGQATLWSLKHDASRLYTELAARANAAGVTFYTLDAGGRRSPEGSDVEAFSWTPVTGLDREIADNETRPLHLLAQVTGGFAITGQDRIEGELARLSGEISGAYSLAYAPPPEGIGETHRLRVEVKRPGLRVRHRESYRHQPPAERLAGAVLAALDVGVADNPGGLRLSFADARPDGGHLVLPVRLAIPYDRLVLAPSGSLYVTQLDLVVAAQDRDGDRSPLAEAEVAVEIPASRAADVRGDYVVTVSLRVSPGEQRVAVGVRDEITGIESIVVGTAEVPGRPLQRRVTAAREERRRSVPGAEMLTGRRPLRLTRDHTYVLPRDPFPTGLRSLDGDDG